MQNKVGVKELRNIVNQTIVEGELLYNKYNQLSELFIQTKKGLPNPLPIYELDNNLLETKLNFENFIRDNGKDFTKLTNAYNYFIAVEGEKLQSITNKMNEKLVIINNYKNIKNSTDDQVGDFADAYIEVNKLKELSDKQNLVIDEIRLGDIEYRDELLRVSKFLNEIFVKFKSLISNTAKGGAALFYGESLN